jgi:periplasmic divalent cation tolerance protein
MAHADEAVLLVFTTLPTEDQARALVGRLVEDRLVACGTVLGSARSIYRWQGCVEEAAEAQVILKTRRDRWDALAAAVQAHHPYDVPELLAVPVERGLSTYISWVADEARPSEERA